MPGLDGDITQFTTPDSDAASVLLRAAEIIEQYGWWQCGKTGADRPGTACVIIAIGRAEAEAKLNLSADDLYASLVREAGVDDWLDLPDWNDAPKRTAAQVCRALRAAAQHSRAERQSGGTG